jgi:hypothetical protein
MKNGERRRLGDVRRRFQSWRKRRARGTKIPPELWKAAADLAREHGVSKTSQELGVDYYSLKRRLDGGAREKVKEHPVEFVDLTRNVLSAGPACAVEVQDSGGFRLRVEFALVEACEVEGLARALWAERR